ncbi:MAG: DUF456 domain-containing protein [Deltaproteobacteria bacterium]|nr:DUF456 domain-containing protein [Deltaproteobacteria bacterium]
MSPLEIIGLTLFILILFAGIFSTLFGIPGTIIILLDVILYAMITGFEKIGIKLIIVLIVLSVLAEAIDFALGMMGAAKFGASPKGVWASVIGGVIGAVVMTPTLFGLGTVMGMFLGGFTAVLIVELIHQRQLKPALRAGYGAFLGRFGGIFVKGFFSLIMIILTLTNIYS